MSFFGSSSRKPPAPIQKPKVPPAIWCGACPACPDLLDTLSSPEHVAVLEASASVYQLYQTHLTAPPHIMVGPNTVFALHKADALNRLREAGVQLAVEALSVKAYTQSSAIMDDEIFETCTALDTAVDLGLMITDIVMDEPLTGGIDGKIDRATLLTLMEQYIRGVKAHQSNVRVGWVEGFNSSAFDYDEPIRVIDRLRERGCSLDFLHYDVDWWICRKEQPFHAERLRTLRALCRDRSLSMGVIVTGHADKGDAGFFTDALELFVFFKTTFGSDWPDRVIVQSWGEPPSAGAPGFTIPHLLGSSGQLALTQRIHSDLT